MEIPISGEDIVSAVCRKLAASYPQTPIYREPIDQDFEEPCFFVWIAKTDTEPVIWPRFQERHSIEVRFYPPERNAQHAEALNIGSELVGVLSSIKVVREGTESLPIFAAECSRRIVDDALVFSARYTTEGYFDEPKAPDMQTIEGAVTPKGE